MKDVLNIKRLEISREYRNAKTKDDEIINKISNQILDVFDKEYYSLLHQPNPDYTDLRNFLMYFMDGNFKKQIKMNLYVSMIMFRVESEFTKEIVYILRPRFFKNKYESKIN
jgi:hypothetical protein